MFDDHVIWIRNLKKEVYLFMGHPVFMIKRDLLGKRKLSPQESKIVTFNLGHIFRVPYSSKTTFSSAPWDSALYAGLMNVSWLGKDCLILLVLLCFLSSESLFQTFCSLEEKLLFCAYHHLGQPCPAPLDEQTRLE